jgi:L-ribulose-5-phosphate 3-epimerase
VICQFVDDNESPDTENGSDGLCVELESEEVVTINRREMMQRGSGLALGAFAGGVLGSGIASPSTAAAKASAFAKSIANPIAVSTYSFWRFRDDSRLTMSQCIDRAARMGFDGVELLRIQMDDDSDGYLQKLKRQAFVNGLDLVGMSTHQGFVTPDETERDANVKKTIGFIEMAYKLGIPTIRVNTGRWRTTKSFDQLMADKGIEKRLPGFTDEDGFGWVIGALEKCLPVAEKCGVILGLENHWGLGITAEGVMRIIEAVDSPWLQATMDTGNFFERRLEQFRLMAPATVFVQAKTYYGGGTWYDIDIDYESIAKILHEVNYRGYVSLEFEGKEDFQTAIPKSLTMLRKAFAST